MSTNLHLDEDNPLYDRLWDYLSGELSEEQAKAFEQFLLSNPQAVEAGVELIEMIVLTREVFCREGAARRELFLGDSSSYRLDDIIFAINAKDKDRNEQSYQADSFGLSVRELCSVCGYLFWQGARRHKVAIASCAATLLLALSLFLFAPGKQTVSPPLRAVRPTVPAEQVVVATLSGAQGARWYDPHVMLGDVLYAGEYLKLEEGFAQITTNKGAVAVLEAPCEIQLTNSQNGIRLVSGKIAGICETEQSKGFVVQTPRMSVTDLGTRFGVQVVNNQQTQVHVFKGEVDVAVRATGQSERILAGSALSYDRKTGFTRMAANANQFTQGIWLDRFAPAIEGNTAYWVGQLSGNIDLGQRESRSLQIYTERQGLLLERDAPVDFGGAVTQWPPARGYGMQKVSAGQSVDVYLLHLDPPHVNNKQAVDCVIDFGRPILGVIGAQDTLVATDEMLGAQACQYPTFDRTDGRQPRGLDVDQFMDSAELIRGGTAIRLSLNGGVVDQIRVVVESRP